MESQHFVVNLETRKKLMSYLISQDNKIQSMLDGAVSVYCLFIY